MKKLFLLAFIFLVACSGQTPQVTVTSEVTITITPTKAPTETPTATVTSTAPSEQVVPTKSTPTPEQMWQKQVEKWGIDSAGVTTSTDTDGKFVVTENEKGKLIYKDGSWDVKYFTNMLVTSGSCKVTDWTGAYIGSNIPKKGSQSFLDEYVEPLYNFYKQLVKLRTIQSKGGEIKVYYMGDGCWANIFYRSNDLQDAWMFWKDANGKPLYEQVFLTGQ